MLPYFQAWPPLVAKAIRELNVSQLELFCLNKSNLLEKIQLCPK